MREILFRGKCKNKIWHYGALHVNTILEDDRYYIQSSMYLDAIHYIEVEKDSVGQLTDSVDIDGDQIFEGCIVNQKSVCVGDDTNFTGYVKFYEGCWWIDNGEDSIPLWSEIRENKIVEWE